MARSNVTTVRYSDEVKEALELVPGETFGDKFEYSVLDFIKSENRRKERIEYLDKQMAIKSEQLNEVLKLLSGMTSLYDDYQLFQLKVNKLLDM